MPKLSNKYYVIYVDDEKKLLKYFKKQFSNLFNVITTTDPRKVDSLIKKVDGNVALVISDQKMHHMKGTDLLSMVRTKYPNILRILTTAYTSFDDSIAAVNESGIFAYLTKPWDIKKAKMVINKALIEFNKKQNYLALSNEIASEIKNPLDDVAKASLSMKERFLNSKSKLSQVDFEEFLRLNHEVSSSVERGNIIIDTILDKVNNRSVDITTRKNCQISDILNLLLSCFGKASSESQRIEFDNNNSQDFVISCNEVVLSYGLYNLLKNLLLADIGITKFEILTQEININYDCNRLIIKPDNFLTFSDCDNLGYKVNFALEIISSFANNVIFENGNLVIEFPKIARVNKESPLKTLLLTTKEIISFDKFFVNKISYEKITKDGDLSKITKDDNYDLIVVDDLEKYQNLVNKFRQINSSNIVLALDHKGQEAKENSIVGVDDFISSKITNIDLRVIAKWTNSKLRPRYFKEFTDLAKFKNKKILLADAKESNLILATKYFTKLAANIDEVKDHDAFVEICRQNKYDVILLDINLLKFSESELLEFITAIEKQNSFTKTKLILILSEVDSYKARQILNLGFDDYWVRDFKYDELGFIVSTVL